MNDPLIAQMSAESDALLGGGSHARLSSPFVSGSSSAATLVSRSSDKDNGAVFGARDKQPRYAKAYTASPRTNPGGGLDGDDDNDDQEFDALLSGWFSRRMGKRRGGRRRRRNDVNGWCTRWSCRWWTWVCAVVVLVLLGVGAMLTWFVILPQHVETLLSTVRIQVMQVNITQPTEHGFQLGMEMNLKPSSNEYEVHVAPMSMTVAYNGTDMGVMVMPQLDLQQGVPSFNISASSMFSITNAAHFTAFSMDMISRKEFTWSLRGQAKLNIKHVPVFGELNYDSMPFHTSTTIVGMDGLADLKVESFDLPSRIQVNTTATGRTPARVRFEGLEIVSQAVLNNPSPVSVYMGDVTFALRYDPGNAAGEQQPLNASTAATIGFMVARDLKLMPGRNQLHLRGALANPDLMPELNAAEFRSADTVRSVASVMFSRILKMGPLKVGVVGFSARDELGHRGFQYNDGTFLPALPTVPWLNASVRAVQNIITMQQPPERGTLLIQNIKMETVNFRIRQGVNNKYRPVVSAELSANLIVPFLFQMDMAQMHVEMSLWTCPGGECVGAAGRASNLIGKLKTDWDPANTRLDTAHGLTMQDGPSQPEPPVATTAQYRLNATMNARKSENVFLDVPIDSVHVYKQFLADVVRQPQVRLVVTGKTAARIRCGMGEFVEVSDVEFESEVEMDGMDGMREPEAIHIADNMQVTDVDVNGTLRFAMDGAYMRKLGSGKRLGLELDSGSRLEFEMFHMPDRGDPLRPIGAKGYKPSVWPGAQPLDDPELGFVVGKIALPTLNLGTGADCSAQVRHPLTNSTWNSTDGRPYCAISPRGDYVMPRHEVDTQLCPDRTLCPGRSFFSSYINGQELLHRPMNVSMRAISGPRDLELALPYMTLRNVSVPGQLHAAYDKRRPPHQLVHRIIVEANWDNLIRGKLYLWLEFYNPLQVPIRYYYLNVDTFLKDSPIGSLHVNFTQYDPLINKTGYVFPGYPNRPWTDKKKDPYGPHPSKRCVDHGDCQLAPIDLPPMGMGGRRCLNGYQTGIHRSGRLEVDISLSIGSWLAMWDLVTNRNETRFNVTMGGQVAAGIGATPFTGPERRDPLAGPLGDHDPYWTPDNPQLEPVYVSWLDFGQNQTELWFRKLFSNGTIPDQPPYYPPECDNEEDGGDGV